MTARMNHDPLRRPMPYHILHLSATMNGTEAATLTGRTMIGNRSGSQVQLRPWIPQTRILLHKTRSRPSLPP
jgi:hypothetical protein